MITIKSNDLFTGIVAGVIAGTMFILADGLNQLINGNIITLFNVALKECIKCRVLVECDWEISKDNVTRPDIMIICDISGKWDKKRNLITPVLIVEILSISTKNKDMGYKKELYGTTGVKYYIIADPQEKLLLIYFNDNGILNEVYQGKGDLFNFDLGPCNASVYMLEVWTKLD